MLRVLGQTGSHELRRALVSSLLAVMVCASFGLAQGTTITVVVTNSQNGPVEQAEVRLGVTGWPIIGYTDEHGELEYTHGSPLGNMRVRVTAPNHGGTETTPSQNTAVDPLFELQTHRVTIVLLDHNGLPLDGGRVDIGHGGWPWIGTTGDDGPGVLYHEYFAGTQNFRMSLNHGSQTKSHVHTVGGSTLTFRTGLLVMQFSGTINYEVGGRPPYVGPSEQLPTPHYFRFQGCGPSQYLYITPVAGEVCEWSMVVLRAVDGDGNGLSGATARWRDNGIWTDISGLTNAGGYLAHAIEWLKGDLRIQMTYDGRTREKIQYHPADSCFTLEFGSEEPFCCVEFGGTLAFSESSEEMAEDPETLAPVSTQPLVFSVATNISTGCLFRLSFTSFERVGGTETLSTSMTYTIEGNPGVTIVDPPGSVDLIATGDTSGTVYLTVTRSGYDDPAGTYEASVTIECLGDCTPGDDCLCKDTRTVGFTIADDCGLFSRGDLDFTDEKKTDVESPGHRGWVESGVLQFKLVTNHLPGVSLTVSGTAFEGTNCSATLPTQARSTWQQGGALDPAFDPLPAWGIVMPDTIRLETDVGPGYYYGQVQLRVERRGYNDPEGTYTASVTIVCSGF